MLRLCPNGGGKVEIEGDRYVMVKGPRERVTKKEVAVCLEQRCPLNARLNGWKYPQIGLTGNGELRFCTPRVYEPTIVMMENDEIGRRKKRL